MKSKLFFVISTFLIVSLLFLPNSFAQDYTQWHLPEGAKARLGKGRVQEITHSPDGTRIAVATSSGIWLYDAQTGEELNLFPPAGVGDSGVFSPDSRMLASSAGGTISLWEVSTGNLIRTMGFGKVVAYSPDGGMLVSKGQNDIFLWEVSTGNLIREIERIEKGFDKRIMCTVYNPKGGMLASGYFDGTICLWDVETGSLIRKLTGHIGPVIDVAFSPEGETLASVGVSEPTVRLWEVSTGNLVHTLDEGRYGRHPETVVFSPEGRTLISGGYPNSILLWEVSTGNPIRELTGDTETGPRNRIISLMLSADGQTLTGGDQNGAIHSWNFGTGRLLRTLKVGINIGRVEFSADGQTLISVGTNGIHLWNPGATSFLHTITEHEIAYVFWGVFSPDRAMIAGHADGTIRLLDAETGSLIHWLSPQLFHGINLAFSPDGQMLAGTGDTRAEWDTTIQLWNIATGSLIRTIIVGEIQNQINSIAFSPDSQTLASAGSNGTHLWDIETGSLIHTFTEHSTYRVVFSSDGQTLASAGRNGTHLWDIETGSLIHTFTEHSIRSVVFSPDSQTLASAGPNGTHLWDVETGSLIHTLTEQERWISSVVFSPDSQTLASASVGNGTHLWETGTGNLLRTLSETYGGFLAFSPDGQTLASTNDGTVLLWDVTPAPSESEKFAADVNGDREVNIQDLVAVAAALGETGENDADVNGDGEVNIQDLVAVAAALGQDAAAPAALRQQAPTHLTTANVQQWLVQAQHANLTDPNSQRGIRFLEQLLSALTPKETALLPNYPNPFNPETWIPYQLSKPAAVNISIYAVDGTLVRTLNLGYQPIGIYQGKSRAAYWDGKNEIGESVASGVYFYTLKAGDFTATRKMLIRK